MLNPHTRHMSEEKYIVGRCPLAWRRELAEGKHLFRARCKSNILRQFASLLVWPFHTERKKAKQISDAMTRWNKTTASYRCFHVDREHSRTENANIVFFVQSDESFQFHKAKFFLL